MRRTSSEKGRHPMVCSRCESGLVANEIRDRDGIPFILWECPRVHRIPPVGKDHQARLWESLRPASCILVPALVAVATMLLIL